MYQFLELLQALVGIAFLALVGVTLYDRFAGSAGGRGRAQIHQVRAAEIRGGGGKRGLAGGGAR